MERWDRQVHDGPPDRVAISWLQVPSPSAYSELRQPIVTLSVQNKEERTFRLVTRTFADGGTTLIRSLESSEATLGPRERTTIEVDLGFAGFDLANLPNSGLLHTSVEVIDTETGDGRIQNSPLVYFHGDLRRSGLLLVYGEEVLRTRFNAGDFRNPPSLDLPASNIERIVAVHITTEPSGENASVAPQTSHDLAHGN